MINIPSPGMYSVIIVVYDKAGNLEYTRCLILYDNQSKVETKPGKRTTVQQSTKGSNYTWVTVNDRTLHVAWQYRFINERHRKHSWLIGVANLPHVKNAYDDHIGKRDVTEVPNVHGKTYN